MKGCRKFRQLVVEAVYDDLDKNEQAWFDNHKEECDDCAAMHESMKSTLRVMESHERVEPEPGFWENYWDNLAPQLSVPAQKKKERPSGRQWLSALLQPAWPVQLAGGLAMMIIGILIGRTYFSPTAEPPQQMSLTPPIESTALTVNQRADRYLERSKLLLMGVVNYDEGKDDLFALDFDRQRQMSQELVQEANLLKYELNERDQQYMRQLVGDLEMILLQIANLESEYDLPDVELVKNAVQSQGVFLRINLEQMYEMPAPEKPVKSDKKTDEDQTI